MTYEDICYLSATEALKLFKKRKLSPVELMQAIIRRTEKVEPKVNAFTATFFDRALDQARMAEDKYMRKGARIRALEGIPLAVKDELPVKGDPITSGSLIHKDDIATETAVIAQRLFNAGVICHARTTTPEFSSAAVTHSRIHGVTRNPWNPKFTSGGSSGGSAASLAAGTTTLATGSDIAGSIRIPASCCGVVGFKPPYGRVPEMNIFNLDFYCHEGPLGRTVADVSLMENIISGPHPSDIATVKPKVRIPAKHKAMRGARVAYSLDLGYFKVDKEVRENTLHAVEAFRKLGCKIEEVQVPWTKESGKAAWDYLRHYWGVSASGYLKKGQKELLTDYVRAFLEDAIKSKPIDFVAANKVACEMYNYFGAMMENFDVFICPTLSKPAIRANDPLDYGTFRERGKDMPDTIGWCMTYPFNMLSRCPVLSVPSGFSKLGVPTGIQIVGKTYMDASVFRAATAYERVAPWAYDRRKSRPII